MRRPLDPRAAAPYLSRMEPLYEGKAKRLWATEDPDVLRMEFKNDATAFNGEKKAQLEGKGVLNNRISEYVMTRLNSIGVQNHFITRLNLREQLIKEVEIIPLEVVCRNIAAGSLSKRFGLPEGQPLPRSIIEFCIKSDELGDPLVNDDYIRELKLATPEELAFLRESALKVNAILGKFFAECGLKLVDFKLEFGRLATDPKTIVLADEISPDGCRLWDLKTGEKMDKDRFRRDLGGVMEAYAEVLERVKVAVK